MFSTLTTSLTSSIASKQEKLFLDYDFMSASWVAGFDSYFDFSISSMASVSFLFPSVFFRSFVFEMQ